MFLAGNNLNAKHLYHKKYCIYVLAWLMPLPLFAATSIISVTIPALVQLSGLNNITLLPINFSSPITGNTTACIYTNITTPLGSYYITATSANASAGTFRVNNASKYVTYSAYWNNSSAALQSTPLTSGVKTAQQTGGSTTSLTCGGIPNANFNISFSTAQITGASPLTYTDTVTLMISPT